MNSGDNEAKLAVAQQLVWTGDVAMPEGWDSELNYIGVDGRTYMPFPIGSSLLYIPCVLVAEILRRVYSAIPVQFVTAFLAVSTNAFISAALCMVLFLAAVAMGYSKRVALITSLVAGLATIVWPYAKQEWSEPPAALAVAIAAYSLVRYHLNPRRRYAVGSGLALGAASLFRLETMALFPVGIGLLAYAWRKANGSHPLHQVLGGFALAYCLAWAPNAWYNYARTGNPLNFVYGEFMQRKEGGRQSHEAPSPGLSAQGALEELSREKGYPPSNRGNLWVQRALSVPKRLPLTIAKILVSPGKSVLFFSPPLFLLPWAWPRFRRQQPENFWLWMGLPIAHGAVLGLYGAGSTWAWGERYWMPVVPLLILPLAALWEVGRSALVSSRSGLSVGLVILVLAGIFVQGLGVATNYHVTYEKYHARGNTLEWHSSNSPLYWDPRSSLLWLSVKELKSLAQGTWWLISQRRAGKDLLHSDDVLADNPSGIRCKIHITAIRYNTYDFWWLYAYFGRIPGFLIAVGLALLGSLAILSGWQLGRCIRAPLA